MTIDRVFRRMFGDRLYFGAVASDGWPTGPCQVPDKAASRLEAYEAGEEVSEAAPGQLSRAQLGAILRSGGGSLGPTIRHQVLQACEDAQAMGLHSDEWVEASRRARAVWSLLPAWVRHAGGARVRMARAEPSLTRGDDETPGAGAVSVVVRPVWR